MVVILLLGMLAIGVEAQAAELQPRTVAAFDRYVKVTEARMAAATGPLYVDTLPEVRRNEALARLRNGIVWIDPIESRDGGREIDVPDGLIHHWVGTVFIPRTSPARVVALLQDYGRHATVYAPAVQRARLISRDGDRFNVFLRFYQSKGISVVVNTENDARFTTVSTRHMRSRIYSTRIAEVENPNTPQERELPVGKDGGYLWRLYTYWEFVERDGGTYVQCESITLTRGIPTGLGWLIKPFITSIPRESLVFTLEKTRGELTGRS